MRKKSISTIVLISSLLLTIMLLDTGILFSQMRMQTRQSGGFQIESVSGKLESTINEAENLTMRMALRAREYLADKDALRDFIYSEKQDILSKHAGAFNIYIAGRDFAYIPDFDMPEDYIATERVWYIGALKNHGQAYVSSPYQDAMTGDICYTVSVMLGDGHTVLGIDYTLETIQEYISQMADKAITAVIVTDEGIIAGCSDKSLVGRKLIDALPDYAGIYTTAKNKEGVSTGRIKSGLLYENLFAAKSGSEWYLIVSVSDFEMYRDSYIQLLMTLVLSLALFSIIIVLYVATVRSREKAENALYSRERFLTHITSELQEPLGRIMERSGRSREGRIENYEEEMASIYHAGEQLSEMVEQIISYKSIILGTQDAQKNTRSKKAAGMDKRFRILIIAIMVFVMLLSLYTNMAATYRWGNARMVSGSKTYEYQLAEWINTQKSILDMFVSVISTNPEMLSNYEGTVQYLDRITKQYPEISVSYMTNPALPHTVFMNNGWEPDENWHVEERQWYIDTMASDSGWSISAPYYDEQTGGYCVTISEVVYDVTSGEFLGVFGIDFFMDKLVNILGDSYSEEGYAFLVDSEGRIINHPYGAYMMTQDGETNVADLPYGEIRADGVTTKYFRDYDGAHKILIAARNTDSNFTVYVVSNTARIYGQVIVTGLIGLVAFLFCIVLVYRLLTNMIRWQEDTNRKLKAAARTAIDAGKAKSNFLAQMSHEIRTPINAVLGMNEMILRESRDENIKEYANNIQSAGRTLLSLINSILDFSKIEDGKMELVPVKYDTSSLINDLINSITDRARAKGLTLVTDIDRSLPASLLGDDVRIRQVIMNILTNAVKYTEAGSVTLTMKGTKRQEDMLVLYVSVKDTGIGIRKEDMSRLFESFERLDETRNRNIEGTGLGMSITIKLLSMMNSMLHVDSVYGEGSDFYFELEQRIVDDEPIGDFASRLKKLNANRKEEQFLIARDAKILVVDDNEMNRKVAYSLMKRNGIIADLAESGEAAIEKISEKNYDIVFLDHMMPKMDGLETLAQLKNRSLIPDGCAMIALTANATSGARERYLAAGFDDYLSKPIEIAELEKKLARWLPPEKTGWSLPEEEVVPHSAPSPPKRDPEADLKEPPQAPDRNPEAGLMEQLQELGLDTETALEFCSMDEEFYEELLRDFIEAYPVKRQELDESFASEDWKTFEVRIHAAKSTLKTLGALALSKRALSLEEAAGQQKAEELAAGYPAFIEEYLELTEHLEEMLR